MTDNAKPECIPIEDEEDGTDEPEEYSVESIRGKRKNPSTGIIEYLIKWEGWPDSDNTWEPIDNLKCPALIAEFEEEEKNKRKTRSASRPRPRKTNSQNLRSANKDTDGATSSFLAENDNNDDTISTATLQSTVAESINSVDGNVQTTNKDLTEPTWHQPKGFARGMPIDEIVGAVDDGKKVFFLVKWKNCSDIDLIEKTEMEDKAPKKLCLWYGERLMYDIKTRSESLMAQ